MSDIITDLRNLALRNAEQLIKECLRDGFNADSKILGTLSLRDLQVLTSATRQGIALTAEHLAIKQVVALARKWEQEAQRQVDLDYVRELREALALVTNPTESEHCEPIEREQAETSISTCEHHWVSEHLPGHLVYWLHQCSLCHEVNWNWLDLAIEEAIKGALERTLHQLKSGEGR